MKNHLPAPPVGSPCADNGPIPAAPPKTKWSQINAFISLNHIHQHICFKSSYFNIQVFHILHHHTTKLLQSFGSFMPERSILEIGNGNWFTTGCTIWQRKKCFTIGCTVSAVSATSLPSTHLWQRLLTCCRQLNSGSELQIRCSHYNVGSES